MEKVSFETGMKSIEVWMVKVMMMSDGIRRV